MTTDSTNDVAGTSTPSQWPQRSVRRPPTSSTAALSNGSATTSQVSENAPLAAATSCVTTSFVPALSELQQVRVVDRGRAAGTEDRHDDRQAHDHLGRRDDHHEERHDLAVEVAVEP